MITVLRMAPHLARNRSEFHGVAADPRGVVLVSEVAAHLAGGPPHWRQMGSQTTEQAEHPGLNMPRQ